MAYRLKSLTLCKFNSTNLSVQMGTSFRSFTKASQPVRKASTITQIKYSVPYVYAWENPSAFSVHNRLISNQTSRRNMNTNPVASTDNISLTTKLQELILSINTLWNRKSELSSNDFQHLFNLCTEAAKLGHRPSQFLLGNFYAQGVGTERNPKLALQWWKEAAKMESASPLSPSTTTPHSSQPLLPEVAVSKQVESSIPEQSVLSGLSDLLQNQAEEQEHVLSAALFAVGVSCINGDPSSVFGPILQHHQRNYLEVDDLDVMVGEDGKVIPKNNQDPSFNFRTWLKGEQRKNRKKQLEGQPTVVSNEIEKNVEEGIEYLIESAQRNFEPAQLSLAHIHLYVMSNEIVGLNWLHVAVQNNKSSQALMQLAEYHFTVKKEAEKAALYYKKASEFGNADADYYLGYMYCAGVGVEQNIHTGVQYLEKAGKSQSEALLYLAQLYQVGDGVPQDYEKMNLYLNASAKLGNPEALFQIAFLNYSGEAGYEVDYTKALKYFKAAARSTAQGHSNAFLNEGVMYYNGLGTDVDLEKAFYAYQNAVSVDPVSIQGNLTELSQNNIAALYNLAYMFQEGQGVAQNTAQADHYYKRAQQLEQQQSESSQQ